MSGEFHEWKSPLERLEGRKPPEEHRSEISSEALEWAKRLLEENAPERGETDPEANKDVPRFQEIPPVTFADGLTLEQMERQRDAGESQERLEPADYTTEPYTDADGLRRYGQIILDKLTPAALENISGTPEKDIPLWTHQSQQNSCAVNYASFILRSEVDPQLTEARLIREGMELNLYYPDVGTYFHDVGALCEVHGMERELQTGATLEDIEQIQEGGGKVIAMISSLKMAYPNRFGFFRADHAVQVVGIDRNDPDDVRVILNDPGRPDGQGLSVPKDVFLKAWATSGHSLAAIYARR